MLLNTRLLERLRPPEIVLSDRLVKWFETLGKGRCLFLGIELSKGPCHDDWCEPIKKTRVEVVDDCLPDEGQIAVQVGGITIVIDGELYYSASKLRDRILIDVRRNGQLKASGFGAF